MVWVWLSITIVLLIAEVCTTQLISIWCAISAGIVTIIVAIFPKLPIPWQIFIFVILCAVLLLLTKKFVVKFLSRTKEQATNL